NSGRAAETTRTESRLTRPVVSTTPSSITRPSTPAWRSNSGYCGSGPVRTSGPFSLPTATQPGGEPETGAAENDAEPTVNGAGVGAPGGGGKLGTRSALRAVAPEPGPLGAHSPALLIP